MVRTTPKIRRMSEGVWDMISAILRSESVREGATTRLTLARDASSNDASRQAAQRVESSNRRPFAKLRWSTARNGTSLSYAPRHRSSVVELSIRNRAVVGSNPTGGSVSPAPLLAVLGPPCQRRFPWHFRGALRGVELQRHVGRVHRYRSSCLHSQQPCADHCGAEIPSFM